MHKLLTKIVVASAMLVSVSFAALCQTSNPIDANTIQRGQYLAIAGDCAACHTNPDDSNPYSGGFAVNSPMGKIYGANITPSKVNGIGNYSLEDFSRALREGVAPGGKYLFPAMPYTAFSGLSDEDIHALYVYFMKGIPPVDHNVSETDLGFPFIRPAMIGWNILFLNKNTIAGSAEGATPIQRGEYLVKTLGHCSTCHTPRNSFAAEKMSEFLSGGKVGAWTAPNITPDNKTGIGEWSNDDIFTYLKTGQLHGKAYADGDMGLAVQNSFSKLTDEDLRAIAAYLKQIPPISIPSQARNGKKVDDHIIIHDVEMGQPNDYNTNFDLSHMTGTEIYNGACATCHGADGQGALSGSNAFPPLRGTTTVNATDPSNLIMTINNGVNRTTNSRQVFMPAFKNQFDEEQLQKVADYVTAHFSVDGHHVSRSQINQALSGGPKPGFLLENAKTLSIAGFFIILLLIIGLIKRLFTAKK